MTRLRIKHPASPDPRALRELRPLLLAALLAAPLAPNEVRTSVDARIDGTRRRAESFIERVLETARADV